MQQLAQKFDVIAPEHPGFGESDTPDWLDNIHDLAYFYLDLLDELKLKDVQPGRAVVRRLDRRRARRAQHAAPGLADALPAPPGSTSPASSSSIRSCAATSSGCATSFTIQKKADDMIARALRPELEDVTLKNRTTVAKIAWQPRGHDPHLAKWLHRIDVPTLLIWGDHDRMFPKEHALAYQKAIPGAKVVIVPECGHVPQIEKPDAFVAALETFLGARKKAA